MTRLVVNGCSYMLSYTCGKGHIELAKQLNINNATRLALAGSCNSRIIRTTLKDSYQSKEKTLYIVGLTFLSRAELPIAETEHFFEGKWISIQNEFNPDCRYNNRWTKNDFDRFIELKLKSELYSIDDYLEQLMYQLLSMIDSLIYRGHQVIVFRNPSDVYDNFLDNTRFEKLIKCVNIINGLNWAAIPWQATQGIKFDPEDHNLAPEIQHPLPGEHGPLNKFLVEYIKQNALHLPVL